MTPDEFAPPERKQRQNLGFRGESDTKNPAARRVCRSPRHTGRVDTGGVGRL